MENNKKEVLGTTLLKGQGLGNQLFCYVTTRCLALEHGYDFSILGKETIANNIHSSCGLYFMDLDFGLSLEESDFKYKYEEEEERLYLPNSSHDLNHGCYITGPVDSLLQIQGDTLISGNMQAEAYYIKYKKEIKEWLKVKEEYDCYEYSKENLCILHLRCTDYLDAPELFLQKKYWMDGMKNMRKINPNMEFMIITNDVKEAEKIIPGVKAYNFDLAKDYSIIKNATYLLLANSSFTYFPAFTSETVKFVIAPKYWARHNVSDGYWASEQNIYTDFHYMDRTGKVFTAEECIRELEAYKKEKQLAKKINVKPSNTLIPFYNLVVLFKAKTHRILRLSRGLKRKIRKKFFAS